MATAKAELPKGKLKWTLLFWVLASYIGSSVIYSILSLFPTNLHGEAYYNGQLAWAIPVSIVVIALGILTPFAIKLWNKVRDKKAAA